MLRAKLKSVLTVEGLLLNEANFDGETGTELELTLVVGVDGDARFANVEELFTLTVCNTSWLFEECKAGKTIAGQYRVFTDTLVEEDFIQRLSRFLGLCIGRSVEEVFTRVSHFARSEFDGYDLGTEYLPYEL